MARSARLAQIPATGPGKISRVGRGRKERRPVGASSAQYGLDFQQTQQKTAGNPRSPPLFKCAARPLLCVQAAFASSPSSEVFSAAPVAGSEEAVG